MSQINDELIQKARSADLAAYFQSSGYDCELRKNELHVKGFGGLYINTQTNQWYCFSQESSRGGNNPINCLTDVIGIDFKSAVEQLSGSRFVYERKQSNDFSISEKEKRELVLPEKADNMRKVFAYLCKTRNINAEIISQLAKDKLLYQDVRGNAVFLHKDDNGKIVGAEIQGTNTYQRFKGVAGGTGESVFSVKIGEPQKCYVFESAIDLLSFKQLAKPEKIQNSLLVSMAGLKAKSLTKIAESGMKMFSCVDNDEAGKKFSDTNNLTPCRKILEENGVKDYNDLLKKLTSNTQQQTQKFSQNAPQPQKKFSHSHR